jgi:hypothetical protein
LWEKKPLGILQASVLFFQVSKSINKVMDILEFANAVELEQ